MPRSPRREELVAAARRRDVLAAEMVSPSKRLSWGNNRTRVRTPSPVDGATSRAASPPLLFSSLPPSPFRPALPGAAAAALGYCSSSPSPGRSLSPGRSSPRRTSPEPPPALSESQRLLLSRSFFRESGGAQTTDAAGAAQLMTNSFGRRVEWNAFEVGELVDFCGGTGDVSLSDWLHFMAAELEDSFMIGEVQDRLEDVERMDRLELSSGMDAVDDPHWRWHCRCEVDVDVTERAAAGEQPVMRLPRGQWLELLELRANGQGLVHGRCVDGWVQMQPPSTGVRKIPQSSLAEVFAAWASLCRASAFGSRQRCTRVFGALVTGTGVAARRAAWEEYEAQNIVALPPPPDEMDAAAGVQWHEERAQRQPQWMSTWNTAEERLKKQQGHGDAASLKPTASPAKDVWGSPKRSAVASDESSDAEGNAVGGFGLDVVEGLRALRESEARAAALEKAAAEEAQAAADEAAALEAEEETAELAALAAAQAAVFHQAQEAAALQETLDQEEPSKHKPTGRPDVVGVWEAEGVLADGIARMTERFELAPHPNGRIIGVGYEHTGDQDVVFTRFVSVSVQPVTDDGQWEMSMQQIFENEDRTIWTADLLWTPGGWAMTGGKWLTPPAASSAGKSRVLKRPPSHQRELTHQPWTGESGLPAHMERLKLLTGSSSTYSPPGKHSPSRSPASGSVSRSDMSSSTAQSELQGSFTAKLLAANVAGSVRDHLADNLAAATLLPATVPTPNKPPRRRRVVTPGEHAGATPNSPDTTVTVPIYTHPRSVSLADTQASGYSRRESVASQLSDITEDLHGQWWSRVDERNSRHPHEEFVAEGKPVVYGHNHSTEGTRSHGPAGPAQTHRFVDRGSPAAPAIDHAMKELDALTSKLESQLVVLQDRRSGQSPQTTPLRSRSTLGGEGGHYNLEPETIGTPSTMMSHLVADHRYVIDDESAGGSMFPERLGSPAQRTPRTKAVRMVASAASSPGLGNSRSPLAEQHRKKEKQAKRAAEAERLKAEETRRKKDEYADTTRLRHAAAAKKAKAKQQRLGKPPPGLGEQRPAVAVQQMTFQQKKQKLKEQRAALRDAEERKKKRSSPAKHRAIKKPDDDEDARIIMKVVPEPSRDSLRGGQYEVADMPLNLQTQPVIVVSCPEFGSLQPDGSPPHNQNVMEQMSLLQHRGLLTLGFDRAGTSNASAEDQQVFQQAERLRVAGSDQWQQLIMQTKWFQAYCGAVKKALCVLAQGDTRGLRGVEAVRTEPARDPAEADQSDWSDLGQSERRGLEVVCIFGGPVTQVEHQAMPRLLEDAAADALKSGVVLRTNMRMMSYHDFHAVAWSFMPVSEAVADPIPETVVESEPDMDQDQAISAVVATRRTAVEERHHGGYHLSHEEREQREQAAVLRQIQQVMHSKRKFHGHSIQNSRALFEEIDRDHSGLVDIKELADALHQLGLGLTPHQVEALARTLDRDGNGEIDYKELLEYLHGDLTKLAPQLGEFVEGNLAAEQQRASLQRIAEAEQAQRKSAAQARAAAFEAEEAERQKAIALEERKQKAKRRLELEEIQLKTEQAEADRVAREAKAADGRPPESTQFSGSGTTKAAGHHSISRRDIMASLHTGADTAKMMLSDDVAEARMKLRAMSYTSHGQDPHSLLSTYDKDRSGELGWDEFRAAVRKGGKVKIEGPHGITDVKLRRLFAVADKDGGGTVSIAELTKFVWGNEEESMRPEPERLPLGWKSAVSRQTGQTYYVNSITNESTYDYPTEAIMAEPNVGESDDSVKAAGPALTLLADTSVDSSDEPTSAMSASSQQSVASAQSEISEAGLAAFDISDKICATATVDAVQLSPTTEHRDRTLAPDNGTGYSPKLKHRGDLTEVKAAVVAARSQGEPTPLAVGTAVSPQIFNKAEEADDPYAYIEGLREGEDSLEAGNAGMSELEAELAKISDALRDDM